jgi:hypothetical protein
MADVTYKVIVARVQAQGCETSRLVRTLQPIAPASTPTSARPPDPS